VFCVKSGHVKHHTSKSELLPSLLPSRRLRALTGDRAAVTVHVAHSVVTMFRLCCVYRDAWTKAIKGKCRLSAASNQLREECVDTGGASAIDAVIYISVSMYFCKHVL
jgi:hypothetical protein